MSAAEKNPQGGGLEALRRRPPTKHASTPRSARERSVRCGKNVAVSSRIAGDYEEVAFYANGGDWVATWHPPEEEPEGQAHGATGICVVDGDQIVLVSEDGEMWGFPGGRTEEGETWRQTLEREMDEEACARVKSARLLGFSRGECTSGAEKGLVLVRSLWRADVELAEWEPRFEIPHRRIIAAGELSEHLFLPEGVEPIFRRMLREAGLSF